MVKKTAVARVLISLAALTLVGVTAMAVGSKGGFTTTSGNRITLYQGTPAQFFTPIDDSNGPYQKIYSNLGKGTSAYNCCTGWTISGTGSIIGAQNWIGEAFTPTSDATIRRIRVAVGYVTGTDGVTLGVASDNNGVPGDYLGKWSRMNIGTFGNCCKVLLGNNQGIPVTAGTQYWLVVQTSHSTNDTWDAFNMSNTASGTLANNTGSGWQNLGNNPQAAFSIWGD